jgi:Mg2+ and Co2+ transporter CorA
MQKNEPQPLIETSTGLLWAFCFSDTEKGVQIGSIPNSDDLQRPGCWYWLHFTSAHEQSRSAIRSLPGLGEDAIEALTHQDGGLRIDADEGVVYGAIADFERDLSGRTDDMSKLFFAVSDNLFISIRRHALYSTDRVRRMFDKGQYPSSPSDLLQMIVTRFIHSANHVLVDLTDTVDDIEDRVLLPDINDDRVRLVPIRRTSVRLYRQIASMKAAFARFENSNANMPSYFYDISKELTRELEAIEHDAQIFQDRARLLHDEMSAKTDSAINGNLRVLSILTSLFLPPTLIAGLFGMNVKDLPFLETPGGFWYVLGLCVLSSFLAYILMKKLDIA